jgi:hypothetical protein
MTDDAPKARGETVLLLSLGKDFTRLDRLLLEVHPSVAVRCTPDRRLILSDDLGQTYLVERTAVSSDSTWTKVAVRQGRPIVSAEYLSRLFEPTT